MNTTISRLRDRYRPERITVLFVAESPPESTDDVRFFYNPRQERWDHMYRAVMTAVFPEFDYRPGEKDRWLHNFKEHGYYLIDATDRPVNRLSAAARHRVLSAAAAGKVVEIKRLVARSTPILLVKKNVFALFARPLRDAGYRVLNDRFLPFPSHGHQARFINDCRHYLREIHGE
jgi:hypothetical protein